MNNPQFIHPIIGITTYGRDEKNHFTLPAEYVDSVRRAGGIPLLIPPGDPHQLELLSVIDGLIISGGGDIDPAHYGGQHHETMYMIDEERDDSELALTRVIVERDMPTLAICRGIQTLNVTLGGTLIEHLPDTLERPVVHRLPPNDPVNQPISRATPHPVTVEAESQLGKIMGQSEVVPMSWHHQALRQLAEGLRVVAQARDGIIEAVELPGHPWLIAVQWHPELSAADDPSQHKIFVALVEAAQARKAALGRDGRD